MILHISTCARLTASKCERQRKDVDISSCEGIAFFSYCDCAARSQPLCDQILSSRRIQLANVMYRYYHA